MRKKYVGTTRRFNYPKQFTTLPDYSAHRGQYVTVIRLLLPGIETDVNIPMYEVRAADGWIGHAHKDELGIRARKSD